MRGTHGEEEKEARKIPSEATPETFRRPARDVLTPLPPATVSGPADEGTVLQVLRSLRPGRSLSVRYIGEGEFSGARGAVYETTFEAAMPLRDFAHVAGSPRKTEDPGPPDPSLLLELSVLGNSGVDGLLGKAGLDPVLLRDLATKRRPGKAGPGDGLEFSGGKGAVPPGGGAAGGGATLPGTSG